MKNTLPRGDFQFLMERRTGTAQLRNAVLTEPWQTREETERDPEDAPLSEETLRRLS
eukprot:COSAG05_NODE_4499_length_1488_cov_1.714183_1_plen_56_part_10